MLNKFFLIYEKIGTSIIKNRKKISNFIYFLCFASFFILTTNNITIYKTGEIALKLLWIILWLPIFANVFQFSLAKKLMIFRKEIGILMGVIVFVHSIQYFVEPYSFMPWEINFWYNNGITYLAWGMLALIITIILTITSNNFSIKKMGKSWKILHRTAYILLFFTLLHIVVLRTSGITGDFINIIIKYLEVFFPFFLYIFFKILEWKNKKINISEIFNKFINNFLQKNDKTK